MKRLPITIASLLFLLFCSLPAFAEEVSFDQLLKQAEEGDVKAQVSAGLVYVKGDGVKQNFAEARRWWEKAAQQGEVDATYYIGLMFARGDGIDKNMEEAKVRWEKAAEKDHIGALFSLGMLFVEGEVVEGNYIEAGNYFMRAAELGNVQSQFNVSVLYAQGLGFPQSNENSYAWAKLAADQGHPNAQEMLKTLEPQMSEEQRKEAQAVFDKVKARVTM